MGAVLLRRWYGARAEPVLTLPRLLLDDLDPEAGGCRWWHGGSHEQIPLDHRKFIADHLFDAANSIIGSLVEAKLHLLEVVDLDRRTQPRFRYQMPFGQRTLASGNSPAEDLLDRHLSMHRVGVIAAAATALDVLAAVTIGICQVPQALRKAGWKHVAELVDQRGVDVPAIVERAGPTGWDTWLVQMRNTAIHRPRRATWTSQQAADGQFARRLARDPDRTQAEAWMAVRRDPVLEAALDEGHVDTLSGVMNSLSLVARDLTSDLAGVWMERRRDEADSGQPAQQWSDVGRPSGFAGYTKALAKPYGKGFLVDPGTVRRLRALGRFDDQQR